MVKHVEIVGYEETQLTFKRLTKGLGDATKLMRNIGNYLAFAILDRTAEGKDVEGLPFEAYSESYKVTRAKKGLPTSKVDLFFTGQMLSSLTYETEKDQVRLFFMNTPRRGSDATNAEIAYYNNEIRKFFAISTSERKAILEMMDTYFERIIKGK